MQKIVKILFRIIGFIFSIEVICIPISLYVNNKHPDLIDEKEFLKIEAIALTLTYIAGIIIHKLTKIK